MSQTSFDLMEPWLPPSDPAALTKEFQREVRRDGLLHGIDLNAIAVRCETDDVLFQVLDGTDRVAVVHLTWSGKTDTRPGWPWTRIYESVAAWRTECMIPDHEDYT